MNQHTIPTQLLYCFLITSSLLSCAERTVRTDKVIIKRTHSTMPIIFENCAGRSNNVQQFKRCPMRYKRAKFIYKREGTNPTYQMLFYTNECHVDITTQDKDNFTITPLKKLNGFAIHNTPRGFSTIIFNSAT